jgi:hypothetical protein
MLIFSFFFHFYGLQGLFIAFSRLFESPHGIIFRTNFRYKIVSVVHQISEK